MPPQSIGSAGKADQVKVTDKEGSPRDDEEFFPSLIHKTKRL